MFWWLKVVVVVVVVVKDIDICNNIDMTLYIPQNPASES